MVKRRALLMLRLDPPVGKEVEWNEWYNNKHIPDRLVLPGFLFARRFIAIDASPKYLTLYELADVSVLNSASYLKLRDWERVQPPGSFWATASERPNLSRSLYEQIYPEQGDYTPPRSEVVLIVGHDVPSDEEEEFNVRYNTERIPAMLRVPGFLTARRFLACKGKLLGTGPELTEAKYVTVYDLASKKVLQSPEFIREKDSSWSSWMRSHSTRKLRGVYRHISTVPARHHDKASR